ncbi:MAG TPA: hypothetical protein VLI05_03930 [Candidatus Saccharimonadia bacterium]|nr:hypothetical protein [Candidatus Saccharimonadia bacterium]
MNDAIAPVAHLFAGVSAIKLRRFLADFSQTDIAQREGRIGAGQLLSQGAQAVSAYYAAANALANRYAATKLLRDHNWWMMVFDYCTDGLNGQIKATLSRQVSAVIRQLKESRNLNDQGLAEGLRHYVNQLNPMVA